MWISFSLKCFLYFTQDIYELVICISAYPDEDISDFVQTILELGYNRREDKFRSLNLA